MLFGSNTEKNLINLNPTINYDAWVLGVVEGVSISQLDKPSDVDLVRDVGLFKKNSSLCRSPGSIS